MTSNTDSEGYADADVDVDASAGTGADADDGPDRAVDTGRDDVGAGVGEESDSARGRSRERSARPPERRAELVALERLSYYLDDLFRVPGTRYRIGLDPLLGLVPGIGDVPTSAASAYIVARAAALGVPRATLARMLVVLVVDAVFGSLPLVGDAFDAVWKANARNVRLAEARLDAPEGASLDRRYVLVVTGLLTLGLLLVGVGVGVTAWWLIGRAGVV